MIPAEHATALRTHVTRNLQAALANVARTAEVARLLAAAAVETIVLKGPLLARRLYGDLAARVSGDVDLLVPEAKLILAARILSEAGYQPETEITPDALRRLRRVEHDVGFRHPSDGILIELHADIAQPHYGYRVDLERWWAGRTETQIGDATVAVLSLEHAYLMSALHAAKHRWHRLDLIADLAAYQRLGVDRGVIHQEAAAAWLLRPVETGEAIAAGVFRGAPPRSGPARAAIAQMIAGKEFGRWPGIWFDVRLRERWRDRLRYLRKRLISAKLRL
jgi:hypothetical protein